MLLSACKGTNKRAKCKRKASFSFHFRAKVPSTSVKGTNKREQYKTKHTKLPKDICLRFLATDYICLMSLQYYRLQFSLLSIPQKKR
jgi:hypothetical protein